MTDIDEDLFAIAWIQLETGLIECAVDTMNEIIGLNPGLTQAQQELFENIHKRRVAPLRAFLDSNDESLGLSPSDAASLPFVRRRVFEKLRAYLNTAIEIVDKTLIPAAVNDKANVFYLRIHGDFFRYISEWADPKHSGATFEEARKSYAAALELAKATLAATDPVLLGLYVNFSLFQQGQLHDPTTALALVNEGLNGYYAANDERQAVDPHDAEEETALIAVLQQNAETWKREPPAS
jgi:hypothetical protein